MYSVIGNKRSRIKMKRMRIGNKVESDHHPVVVYIESNKQQKKNGKRENGKSEKRLTEKGKKHLMESMRQKLKRRTRIKEKQKEIKNWINKTLEQVGKKRKREGNGGEMRKLEKNEKNEEKVIK